MSGTFRILDAPRFLRPLRRALEETVSDLLNTSSKPILEFGDAQYDGDRTIWRMKRGRNLLISLHLIGLKEVLVVCEDRDVFEHCIEPLRSHMKSNTLAEERGLLFTTGIDVTIVYHDNDTVSH